MDGQPRRLDSWKEIADYLGRDVRTAMRWSKSQGLPVRRVAGGKGRSVFAFASEIDTWLAGHTIEARTGTPPGSTSEGPMSANRRFHWFWVAAAFAIVLLAFVVIARPFLTVRSAFDAATVRVISDPTSVTLKDPSGLSTIVYRFDPQLLTVLVGGREMGPAEVADIDGSSTPRVLVGVAYQTGRIDNRTHSGQLLALSLAGDVQWRSGFDDTIRFRQESFGEPWGLTDWQVTPEVGVKRIAVAAHHYLWWPSILALLDARGHRLGTFINPGWIEHVRWLDANRIAATGFNNERNEGMLAVVNAQRMAGQAPVTAG